MNTVVNLSPFIVCSALFAIILGMAFFRALEKKHIHKAFSNEDIILVSFGATWFGQESSVKHALRKYGTVIIATDGIFYHARFGSEKFLIPSASIKTAGTTDFFCDRPLHDTLIQIVFVNDAGNLDRMVFRIPAPAKWLRIAQNVIGQKNDVYPVIK